MKTKTFRTFAAALMTGLLLPQCIGAADLAVMMGPAARPLMFPQPGRLAPFPRTASPAPSRPRKSWSQRLQEFSNDVSAVAAWLNTSKKEDGIPAVAAPHPAFAKRTSEDIPVAPAPDTAPGFSMAERSLTPAGDPTLDRMFVQEPRAVFDFIPMESRQPVYAPRLEMPWIEGRGIRFRMVYLDPPGVTWGDSKGFHGQVGDESFNAEVRVPERYWRHFPLYFARDRVLYEIQIENTGAKTLTGLSISSVQEAFNMAGGKGPDLLEPRTTLFLPPLKPGERMVKANSFSFSHGSHASINFEQTHLTVVQGGETLADAPQAGIADPPNEP